MVFRYHVRYELKAWAGGTGVLNFIYAEVLTRRFNPSWQILDLPLCSTFLAGDVGLIKTSFETSYIIVF